MLPDHRDWLRGSDVVPRTPIVLPISGVEVFLEDKVIQAILRHEDVSTTQRSYIKTVPQVVTDAMNQLEARIARAAVVQQVAVN
jgi:integrase